MEQQAVYALTSTCTDATGAAAYGTQLAQSPLTALYCPSRRQAKTYPTSSLIAASAYGLSTSNYYIGETAGTNLALGTVGTAVISSIAKTDYAANRGDYNISLQDAATSYGGTAITIKNTSGVDSLLGTTSGKAVLAYINGLASGVVYTTSTVSISQVSDGTSNTIFAAEKYLDPDYYESNPNLANTDSGDDGCAYAGDQVDITRNASDALTSNPSGNLEKFNPKRDTSGVDTWNNWGGPHAGGFNSVFVDGSVRQLSYGISTNVMIELANRKDGRAIDVTDLAY
jgi:prepilin-type processing-associated H-X9-DG protein